MYSLTAAISAYQHIHTVSQNMHSSARSLAYVHAQTGACTKVHMLGMNGSLDIIHIAKGLRNMSVQ